MEGAREDSGETVGVECGSQLPLSVAAGDQIVGTGFSLCLSGLF
jgi:hypothetical protein